MEICEELLRAESNALEHREKDVPFDGFALLVRLLAIDNVRALAPAAPITMRLCRQFYALGRSFDTLPLAQTVLERANSLGAPEFAHPAANACGLLSAVTADIAAAIDYHGQAIPIHARKSAAADTNDSLIENAPRDRNGSMNNVFIQLGRAAGSQLDLKLVPCFIHAVRNEADNEGVSFFGR